MLKFVIRYFIEKLKFYGLADQLKTYKNTQKVQGKLIQKLNIFDIYQNDDVYSKIIYINRSKS